MKKIYRFHTKINGETIYTTDPNARHPHFENDSKYEVELTKKNLINYILSEQEEPNYTISELRKMTKNELLVIAGLYDVFESAKEAGAEILEKSFLRDSDFDNDPQRAFDILAAKIPGFAEYYEKTAIVVDAWTDICTIDCVTHAVYGEGELSQSDDVIALREVVS